jgi:hypothetical protein
MPAEELDQDDSYHMPAAYDAEGKVLQSKRYEVLTARYRDAEAEEKQETPWAQQEQFEAEQIKKAITSVGARDRKTKGGALLGGVERESVEWMERKGRAGGHAVWGLLWGGVEGGGWVRARPRAMQGGLGVIWNGNASCG